MAEQPLSSAKAEIRDFGGWAVGSCRRPSASPQVFFLINRVTELAAKDPSIRERQPFKALLERDYPALHAAGKQALLELFFATHRRHGRGVPRDRCWLAADRKASKVRALVQGMHLPFAG